MLRIRQLLSLFFLFIPVGRKILQKILVLPPRSVANLLFVINIPPTSIKKMVKFENRNIQNNIFLPEGNWDKSTVDLPYLSIEREFTNYDFGDDSAFTVLHCCLIEYHNNRDYKQHNFYKKFCEWIENGNSNNMNGFVISKKEHVDEYLSKYIRLYHSIKSNGFQRKLTDDITGIAIARDGEILKDKNGRHRLLVCLILQLESIPVVIRKIHFSYFKNHCAMICQFYSVLNKIKRNLEANIH